MTKKLVGPLDEQTGVRCSCDVGVTQFVARGSNCCYHRKGCPARDYWESRK